MALNLPTQLPTNITIKHGGYYETTSKPYLECLVDKIALNIDSGSVPQPDESMLPSGSIFPNIDMSIDSADLGWRILAQACNIPQNIINEFPGGTSLFLKLMSWEYQEIARELAKTTLQEYFEAKFIFHLASATCLEKNRSLFVEHFDFMVFRAKSNLCIIRFIADLIEQQPKFPTKAGPAPALRGSESYLSIISTCCCWIPRLSVECEPALKLVCHSDFPTFNLLVSKFCPRCPNKQQIKRAAQSSAYTSVEIAQLKGKTNEPKDVLEGLTRLVCSGPFREPSSYVPSRLSKWLPELLAALPKNFTLSSMGSSKLCNKQLLTLIWPYFTLFEKACLQEQQQLDLGARLTPTALEQLVEYFQTGKADFSHFDARSVLLHAAELRMMDEKGQGIQGFERLVEHLMLVISNIDLTIPIQDVGYGIALGSKDAEIWSLSIETWGLDFSGALSSRSIEWLRRYDWDLFWLATCELLRIKPTAGKT